MSAMRDYVYVYRGVCSLVYRPRPSCVRVLSLQGLTNVVNVCVCLV